MHRLPTDDFRENNNLNAADEDSSIHNLVFALFGLKEFDATKNSQSEKNERVSPNPD